MSKRKYLTPNEVADRLMVSPVTVRQWAQKGLIEAATTIGGHRRFALEDIEEFARSRGLASAPEFKSGIRILVVDDDEQVGGFLSELLRSRDDVEAVVIARDGYGAGSKVQSFKPDVIILDLMMPGMNGFEVCQQLQADPATSEIRVIVVTGFHSPENIARVMEAGAVACLPKPIDTKALLELIGLAGGGAQKPLDDELDVI